MRLEDLSLPFLIVAAVVVVRFALWLRGIGWVMARSWWFALALVVGGAAAAMIVAWELAGPIALGLCYALLLAPNQLQNAAVRTLRRGDERRALVFARLAALLHPSALFRERPRFLALLLALRLGETPTAELEHFSRDPEIGAILPWLCAHVRGDVPTLIAGMGDPEARRALLERGLGVMFLRAVGVRTGDGDALAHAFEEVRSLDPTLRSADVGAVVVVMVPALAGEVELTRAHAEALQMYLAPGEAEAAVAVAYARRGRADEAEAVLAGAELRHRGDRLALALLGVYRRILRDHLVPRSDAPAPALDGLLRRLAADAPALRTLATTEGRGAGRLPVTWTLMAILTIVYVITAIAGDPLEPAHLYAWGGLATTTDDPGWWLRLFTATLLHAGVLHLGFNLIGLAFFGRFVEPVFGPLRALVLYIACAGLSSLAVVLLADPAAPQILVGASGAILGLAGAALAGLLAQPTLRRSPRGRAQIRGLLVIFVLQVVLDQLTPAVSGVAHLSGLVIGLGLGLLLAPRGPRR